MLKHYKNQQGIILIFSLMIMAILLSTALGFGLFIISDLRQARDIDDALSAYYVADAGLERTLYLFRHADKEKIGNFAGLENTLSANDKNEDLNGDGVVDWTIEESTDYEPIFFRQRLYSGQSAKLYFIGRNDGSNNSQSLKVEWVKGLNAPKLQVIFTQLTPLTENGALVYYTDANQVEISDTLQLNNPVCFDFKDKDINGSTLAPPSDYMVELRVIGTSGDYVDNLSVTAYNEKKGLNGCNSLAYNSAYNPQAISNITLKSRGSHGQASQTIYAQIPPRDPAAGLVGFVLFSEEDITKGY